MCVCGIPEHALRDLQLHIQLRAVRFLIVLVEERDARHVDRRALVRGQRGGRQRQHLSVRACAGGGGGGVGSDEWMGKKTEDRFEKKVQKGADNTS